MGWWDVAFSAWDDSARARSSISLFPTADHAQTFSFSSFTPSSPLEHHPYPSLYPLTSSTTTTFTSAIMVHTNGNAAHGETFLYVAPRDQHHHNGPIGLYTYM